MCDSLGSRLTDGVETVSLMGVLTLDGSDRNSRCDALLGG